ncbi:MAG: hypothetical protein ACU84Q_20245 [Gammaproteobacteria bacterium]
MSYETHVAKNNNHIVCIVSQPIARADACKFASDMLVLAEANGIRRFLVDVRNAPNESTAEENYRFAHEDLPQLGFPYESLVAILTRVGDSSHDFVEMVSRNAGYSVKLLDEEARAIAWLGH